MGFHPEGFRRAGARGGNRQAKRDLVEAGTVRQILVYDDDRACVGWCQYGTPEDLPNIKNRKAYDRSVEDLAHRLHLHRGQRRGQGVARAAVQAAITAMSQAGGGIVGAYPEQTIDRAPQRGAYLHTGPEALYAGFGFVRDRRIAKWRWVMRTQVLADPVPPVQSAAGRALRR